MSTDASIPDDSKKILRRYTFLKGACFGLALGIVALAWVAIMGWQRTSSPGFPSEELLKASATHGSGTFAVATGMVSEEADGVFFLDFITGELTCLVYNPRRPGFGARFMTNVAAVLPPGGQNPQYLMVTGSINNNRATAGARPGGCLVYVVEPSTGAFAAFAIPWDRTAEAVGGGQIGALIPVGKGQISNRGGVIRDDK